MVGLKRVAVLLDKFPQISQTFIDNQVLSLLELGIEVTILSFGRGRTEQLHSSTMQILMRAKIVYLRVPKSLWWLWVDLAFLAAHVRPTSRVALRAAYRGWRPTWYDLIKLAMAAVGLEDQVRRFDLIFCHFGPTGRFGALMRDVGLIEGRVVTFFHGYDFSSLVRTNGAAFYSPLFERGDVFVANTNFTRRRLAELGCPTQRTITISVGLYPDQFPYRERQPDSGRSIRFLSVGRLVEKKGHAYAIRAFRRVLSDGLPATYAIVGEGPERPRLEQLIAELGMTSNVTLLGARTQQDVVKLAGEVDMFVLASTSGSDGDVEGQGLALQEAQAMGLPVIATNHNGFPEGLIDGVTGILVPEGNSDSLARAMIELARHPERWVPMGRAGAAFVRAKFDQVLLTGRLIALLAEPDSR